MIHPALRFSFLLALAGLLAAAPALARQGEAPDRERRIEREVVVVSGDDETGTTTVLRAFAARGYLGVRLVDLTPELRRHFGVPAEAGVMVSRVVADSPAANAGLLVGDVITAIDGEAVGSSGQLAGRLGRRADGDTATLTVWRDGARLELTAVVDERERRQLDVGSLLRRGESGGARLFRLDPEEIEGVIAIDPESVNESIRRLMDRLESDDLPGRWPCQQPDRQALLERLAEMERRLAEMERRLAEAGDE